MPGELSHRDAGGRGRNIPGGARTVERLPKADHCNFKRYELQFRAANLCVAAGKFLPVDFSAVPGTTVFPGNDRCIRKREPAPVHPGWVLFPGRRAAISVPRHRRCRLRK